MLRTLLVTMVAAAILTAGASPLFAQAKKKGETVYDFDGDVIETEYMKPDQMTIEAVSKRKDQGFIKIRTDFVKEIVRSAEDL